MAFKTLLKKDYILVLLLSVMCFLTIKNFIPEVVYLIIALLVSIYFFPVKLFLGNDFLKSSKKKRVVVALSYFVVSNTITLTALTIFQDERGFMNTAIFIYSIINIVFLLYFHFSENMRYNFVLTCCTTILTSAVIGLQYE